MRVAVIHTRYRQRGGEDVVVDAEVALLQGAGHEVERIDFDNAELARRPRMAAAAATLWNRGAVRHVEDVLARRPPDVVHVHNTFPAASPAVFWAARRFPVVHTIHNYRWLCLAATLLRDGRPCTDCVGTHPWRGVAYGCYDGRAASAVVAGTLVAHRALGTLATVDRLIALTHFARDRLLQGGLPADRLVVRPNFTVASTRSDPSERTGDGAPFLFVGRLEPGKGLGVVAEAWRRGGLPPLDVIGTGPLADELASVPGVRLLGALPSSRVRTHLAGARALLVPSLWFEGCPMVVLEAYAEAVPVIGSDLGAVGELVEDGSTGWRVPAGDAGALAAAVRRVAAMPDEAWRAASAAALTRYHERYAPEAGLASLLAIYRDAGRVNDEVWRRAPRRRGVRGS